MPVEVALFAAMVKKAISSVFCFCFFIFTLTLVFALGEENSHWPSAGVIIIIIIIVVVVVVVVVIKSGYNCENIGLFSQVVGKEFIISTIGAC